jgi:hypothetical protein
MAAGLMEDSARMARLRLCARAMAESINWESVIDKFESVLRGVIQGQQDANV